MESGASVVGLDFDASLAWPIYDWMGVAKAALESVSRYLARDLGPAGDPRQPRRRPARSAPSPRAGSPGFEQLAELWRAAGAARAGTSRTPRRSRARSAFCSPTTRARSAARSSTSTAAFTPSARRPTFRSGPAPLPSVECRAAGCHPSATSASARCWARSRSRSRASSCASATRRRRRRRSSAAPTRCPVLGLLAWLEDRRFGRRSWRERRVALALGRVLRV